MKKMPTLFVKKFDESGRAMRPVTREVTKGCEWVFEEEVIATRKFDGTCCLVKGDKIYARFDLKKGRVLPEGAIPCQEEADSFTGHFPHWVPVEKQPQYKHHKVAFERQKPLEEGTYELCGPHFQKNVDNLDKEKDILIKHGSEILDLGKNLNHDIIECFLAEHFIEGIVFYRNNGDMCKIKRSDFGYKWGH